MAAILLVCNTADVVTAAIHTAILYSNLFQVLVLQKITAENYSLCCRKSLSVLQKIVQSHALIRSPAQRWLNAAQHPLKQLNPIALQPQTNKLSPTALQLLPTPKLNPIAVQLHTSKLSPVSVQVFDAKDWDALLMRSIVPKLAWALQDVLVINPLQQDLAPFHWLTAWHAVLSQHHMVNLLEFRFFPAWHRVLQHWLSSSPDFDEVTRWYMGWKVKRMPMSIPQPATLVLDTAKFHH